MMAMPAISQAMPGAKVLVVDNPNHKVIEIDPITKTVVGGYGGTGTLNYPNEAIPLTNGNILIADTYNGRIIEVTSDTKQIVGSYSFGFEGPVDVKRCMDYKGTPTDTLLITDFKVEGGGRIVEIPYNFLTNPGGGWVWELFASSLGGNDLFWEAEKRPGAGTPTYLITSRTLSGQGGGNRVMVVERTGISSGTITWQYTGLTDPRDANWTPCGNVLINRYGCSSSD